MEHASPGAIAVVALDGCTGSHCVYATSVTLTAEDLFAALVEHLRQATNGGKICPMISIFAPQLPGEPGIRIGIRSSSAMRVIVNLMEV